MTCELTTTRAFWLGHLCHASALSMPLSDYADSQALALTDLLTWGKRLSVQDLPRWCMNCPITLATATRTAPRRKRIGWWQTGNDVFRG